MKHKIMSIGLITSLFFTTILSSCKVEDLASYLKRQEFKIDPMPMMWHRGGGGTVKFELNANLEKFSQKDNKIVVEVYYRTGDPQTQNEISAADKNAFQRQVAKLEYKSNEHLSTGPNVEQEMSFKYSIENINKFASSPVGNMGGLWLRGHGERTKGKPKPADYPAVEEEMFRLPGEAIGVDLTMLFLKEPITVFIDGLGLLAYRPNGDLGDVPVKDSPYDYISSTPEGSEQIDTVNINFEQGISIAKQNFRNNKEAFSVIDLFIKEKVPPFKAVGSSSHSPEGTEVLNKGLSKNRSLALQNEFFRQMERYNYKKTDFSEYRKGFEIDEKVLDETWIEFKNLVNESTLTDAQKKEVLAIVNAKEGFVEKQNKLTKLSYYQKMFDEIYPLMRYARVIIYRQVATRELPELSALSKQIQKGEAPTDAMSEAEYLELANNTPDTKERVDILEKGLKSYPTDRMFNNVGAAYMDNSEMELSEEEKKRAREEAIKYFEASLNKGNSYEANYNLGLAYLAEGDAEKAQKYLDAANAVKVTPTVDELINGINAFGVLDVALSNKDYEQAQGLLDKAGDFYYVNFNKGLANYMLGNYDAALQNFARAAEQDEKSGDAFYVHALCAAKKGDYTMMSASLKKAFAIDSALKDRAGRDVVFTLIRRQSAEANTQFEAAY